MFIASVDVANSLQRALDDLVGFLASRPAHTSLVSCPTRDRAR